MTIQTEAPRHRALFIAYYALVDASGLVPHAGSDAGEARFWDVDALPGKLAFDHDLILGHALSRLRYKTEYAPVAFQLLPERFTLAQLQAVYEVVLGRTLDKRNFRRKIALLGILRPTGRSSSTKGRRPARLHRFAAARFEKLKDKGILFPF